MIGIKTINELPKNCCDCPFCVDKEIKPDDYASEVFHEWLYVCFFSEEVVDVYADERCDDCPLVDIDKEGKDG